ncbi:replicative DNA helicase [Escherichia albertii]|uniref:replicative DNA helicase n=1 Tax=Escherichia albertii TaxID=208962 RepID=UPI00181A74F7|nr:DnaB-like helicase C-terminal domain-containing protein [Escherichia albertii]MCI5275827.1 helicase DnaB [Escherichia albertii]MCZ8661473.1 AAA family ATPase [Escherichia albertii]MCZ9009719.1 AAA family ATPase [Escherichia albertii]HCZ5333268.1 AAA family ATPase [Escherichia albertii]
MTNNLHYSVETEQAVLGCLMVNTDHERADQVYAMLKSSSFYLRTHTVIFGALRGLHREQQPTDLLTLAEKLESAGRADEVGGFAYLAEISRSATPSAMVHYAAIVREKAVMRYAVEKLNSCLEIMSSPADTNANSRIDAVQQIISAVAEHARTGRKGGLRPAGDVVTDWVDDLERRFNNPESAAGLTLGIGSLDRMMAPKQALRGSLVVIGARPKMGKTATFNKIATHFALNHRLPTLVFSLEMTDRSLIERMVAQEAGINSEIFYTGANHDSDMSVAMAKALELSESNLMIDSTPGVTLAHVVSECRKVKRQRGVVGLVAIDYLTLMKAEAAERRDIAFGDITTGLKNLAKELDCVVLLLTQLNRKLEDRADKRPTPSDSKDTGQIEQDCDVWIGLYRGIVYDQHADPQLMELLLRLNREGATGTAYALMKNGSVVGISDEEVARRQASRPANKKRYAQEDF